MRNVFLCFLTVLLFTPDAVLASGASRASQRNESGANSVRVASPVRKGITRSATNGITNSRSEKNIIRTGDVVSRTAKATHSAEGNVVSRSATTGQSVVSRNQEQTRGNPNVRQRRQSVIDELVTKTNGTNERGVTGRAATSVKDKKVSAQDVAAAKDLLEQTASLNKSCQDQYNECMDQFCAVVDSNQKRCSCSANLSKYSKVQEAVTNANDELNLVAQRIRYVGLSADEIRAIMTETQAEAELDKTKDTSETRSMLSKIEELIQDPTTTTSSYSADNNFGLDLEIDFSDDSADIFSLDFLSGDNDSISSKRGTALYNAAKKRCKTILNSCTDVGATSAQITGNYELAIDKDCIAYEQGLQKMNQTLQSNVRSAGLMLQKARLAVMQNKNQYDTKGCIGALESCMTDDMVCGSNYLKCLDPTKRYIDENGNVVLGQDITNITDFMDGFNSAVIDSSKLSAASSVNIDSGCATSPNNDGACVIKYLLNKIGTGATVKDGGLCRAVLDKCQQYTYNTSGDKYNPYNDVVVNYVQRAMVNIKSAQQQIISDYAENCMTDVASCYNQQVTQVNSWSSIASVSSIKGVMTGACRNVALTCAYAVFKGMCNNGTTTATASNVINWVLQGSSSASSSCTPCDVNHQAECIEGISEIFYQSLLCPDNSIYNTSCASGTVTNRKIAGCVNSQCKCEAGYTSWNGACVTTCPSDKYRNEYGTCTECSSGTVSGGVTDDIENNTCTTATTNSTQSNNQSTNQSSNISSSNTGISGSSAGTSTTGGNQNSGSNSSSTTPNTTTTGSSANTGGSSSLQP